MAVKCGKAHGYHATAKDVFRCYNGEDVPTVDTGETVTGERRATDGQQSYLKDLCAKRGVLTVKPIEAYGIREVSPVLAFLRVAVRGQISDRDLKEFGLVEDGASLAPGKPAGYSVPSKPRVGRTDPQTLADGIYRDDKGTIFKVITAQYGDATGRKYAKRLVITAEPIRNHAGEVVRAGEGRFEKAPGAAFGLRPDMLMPVEEAKEFGKLYGFCVRCARILTKEESIERGLGDWCAAQWGL